MDYDVFISFKNSDENGRQTIESVTAKRLYDFLKAQGLRVFFSNVELEFSGKAQYTKAIDEALDSSQFLIAVGSSYDNLNSQWVRYEWESFLNDIRSGIKPDAEVYVVCEGMKIHELPRALRQQQAFFADEPGSFEKLCNFIKNAQGAKDSHPATSIASVQSSEPGQEPAHDAIQSTPEELFEWYEKEDGTLSIKFRGSGLPFRWGAIENASQGLTNKGSQAAIFADVTIPKTIAGKPVTTISYGAFSNCTIGRLVLPEGLTTIIAHAFQDCSISKMYIPESVQRIDATSFTGCTDLTLMVKAGSYTERFAWENKLNTDYY